ncbi:MAG TPA: NAD(P)-dependent oxidoreductase, partial [Anaerolineae bacterium]|nr:NAD(P)-dependent oxidoreductase [Anaerolineae bacterium]
GIFQSAHDGLLLIDMTSNDPALARQLAQRAQTLGIEMLDAPVSGGAIGAQQATLTIMVGGTREGFDRAVPILSHLATTVVHVGAAGAGQITKAVNQMLVGITIAAVSEGIVLLEKAGVDVDAARRAMLNGFAASRVLDYHGARMIQRDFQPGGRARLHLKDLNIALTLADQYHVSTPTTQIVRDLFQTLVNQGDGDLDHSALIKVIQRASTP